PADQLRVAVLHQDLEDDPLLDLEPRGRPPAGTVWTGALLQDDAFAALLADPQRPEARGVLGDRDDGDSVGVKRPLQILQAFPAIGPGLRHDVPAPELEDVKGEEGRDTIPSTAGLEHRLDPVGARLATELAVDDGLGHRPADVPQPGHPGMVEEVKV